MVYSVVIPVYNGENTLEELTIRISKVMDSLEPPYEIIFIDDSSRDHSWNVLSTLRQKHPHLRCFRLTRNYGQQNATMCGFMKATGKYVITLDDDLQNPPETIPALIEEIQKGFDVVFGIYEHKKHRLYRRWGANLVNKFYALTFKSEHRVSAFRIMRSELSKSILDYDLNYTYINGLLSWYTDRISHVLVPHKDRAIGKSGYTIKKLLALSLNVMTNFSILPLQIASLVGILFSCLGFGMGVFFVIKRLLLGSSVSGFTALIASISFFSGMILFFLGIIGEYLGRIHLNINHKPQFCIREEHEKPTDN